MTKSNSVKLLKWIEKNNIIEQVPYIEDINQILSLSDDEVKKVLKEKNKVLKILKFGVYLSNNIKDFEKEDIVIEYFKGNKKFIKEELLYYILKVADNKLALSKTNYFEYLKAIILSKGKEQAKYGCYVLENKFVKHSDNPLLYMKAITKANSEAGAEYGFYILNNESVTSAKNPIYHIRSVTTCEKENQAKCRFRKLIK